MYELMNKDEVVLDFIKDDKVKMKWTNLEESFEIANLYGKLPYGMENGNITRWFQMRRASPKRINMRLLFKQHGIYSLDSYVGFTHSISFNDTFWVREKGSTLSFADINPYKHDIDLVTARAAFSGASCDLAKSKSTEWSTAGNLKKCWIQKDGIIQLVKASSDENNTHGEVYSEFLCHQLLNALGFAHVPYTITTFEGEMASICPLFTNEDKGLVTVYNLLDYEKEEMLGVLDFYEVRGWREEMSQLLVFDALVCNQDRHLNNFAFYMDNTSMELLNPFPIYDNGMSLLFDVEFDSLTEAVYEADRTLPKLYGDFEMAANEMLTDNTRSALKNLSGFKFVSHPEFPIEQNRLDILSQLVLYRASVILKGF